jgi:hypothetical protein
MEFLFVLCTRYLFNDAVSVPDYTLLRGKNVSKR